MHRATTPILTRRALGRATLARQLLLERADLSAASAIAGVAGAPGAGRKSALHRPLESAARV